MYKYIISWCLNIATSNVSPVVLDEFGRPIASYMNHSYSYNIECGKHREFLNREEAVNFYGKAKAEEKSLYANTKVCNVTADSVLIDSVKK